MRPSRALAGAVLSVGLLGGCAATTTSATPAGGVMPSGMASGMPSNMPSMPSGMPSGTAGTAALCAASANLTASVKDLTTLTISDGVAGIQAKVQAIQTNLDAFQAAARADFAPQVSALRGALANLQTALKSVAASPGAAAIAGLVPQVSAVVTAWNALQQAVSTRCG